MVIDAGVNATGNKSGACPDEEEFVGQMLTNQLGEDLTLLNKKHNH